MQWHDNAGVQIYSGGYLHTRHLQAQALTDEQLQVKTEECRRECVEVVKPVCPRDEVGNWNETLAGDTATQPCLDPRFVGNRTRFCNLQGEWERPTVCTAPPCGDEGEWPSTPINTEVQISCNSSLGEPQPGYRYSGSLTRSCNALGEWRDPRVSFKSTPLCALCS